MSRMIFPGQAWQAAHEDHTHQPPLLHLMWLQSVVEQLLQKNIDDAIKNGEADKGDEHLEFKGFTGQTLVSGSKFQAKFHTRCPITWIEDKLVVTLDLNEGVAWLCTEHGDRLGGASLMLDAVKLRR